MINPLKALTAAAFVSILSAAPMVAHAEAPTAVGTFTGASDHITTGGVSIFKSANGGSVVVLDSNFSLDGAPDPRVGFGKDGTYIEAIDLGALASKDGMQFYVVPESIDLADINEIYIWCRKFSVPLGVASLK